MARSPVSEQSRAVETLLVVSGLIVNAVLIAAVQVGGWVVFSICVPVAVAIGWGLVRTRSRRV